ncbi:MAG: PDZ domain-containing protein [Acidobacteria bacterium]|nr:PDZ domain-containing protein [Acidobacteriota bacterium]
MELSPPHRPRVSRETRLLLSTALVAVLALWVLARVRFPDRPAPATPLEPLLTQIGARSTFDDLASELATLRPRVEPLFAGASLRVRADAALLPRSDAAPTHGSGRADVVADPVSGVVVVRLDNAGPLPVPWRTNDLAQPRYFVTAGRSEQALTLRPVFVDALTPIRRPPWRDLIWRVPPGVDIGADSFVFTTDAQFAGLAIDLPDGVAIVPSAALLAEVDRLMASGPRTPGYHGVDVQALTPALAKATAATGGVIVAWVDPDGPAAGILAVGDVIEAVDDAPVTTPLDWTGWTAGTPAGQTLTVRVRRGTDLQTFGIITAPRRPAPEARALGLQLRTMSGTGSVVVRVQSGSAADRAGLRADDVITRIGDAAAPTPAVVRRAFDRAPSGSALLVAYTRAGGRRITALDTR